MGGQDAAMEDGREATGKIGFGMGGGGVQGGLVDVRQRDIRGDCM